MTTHTDRIRQMAQEAGFSVDENGAINDGVETAADFSEELARFAQLVAEDCAQHVNRSLTDGRSPMGKVASEAIRARYSLKD